MKKILLKYCLFFCGIIISAISCIRDRIEPCPPLSVLVEVTDKNYFNINEISLETPVGEDLPFGSYISSLRYSLKDMATGDIVEQNEVMSFDDDCKSFKICFCDCIPHGTYVLTIFAGGGRNYLPLTFDETGQNLKLHPDNSEDQDIYLTADTLVYDAWNYDYTVGLERAKGKLLVLMENFPSNCSMLTHFVSDLYDIVTPSLGYEGQSFVKKSFSLADPNNCISRTLLSPSIDEGESDFSLVLTDKSGTVIPGPHNKTVKVGIRRNELSLLRYSYGAGGKLVICVFVNDHWEQIHSMEID